MNTSKNSSESAAKIPEKRLFKKNFRNPLPEITFPEALPVSSRRDEIARALKAHQVLIICGETGSGKTTQLPKICLSIGRGEKGLIGHTQPRRIAASSTAKRIAAELDSSLGEHVGFKVRFSDHVSNGASVKLMTDGILLAETQGDPLLRQYDTLIIDEAHERSLNIDFLLGYIKKLLPRRPDLKLIITSATIDAQRFACHFGTIENPAPVIEISGRLYPVELRYRPVDTTHELNENSQSKRDLTDAIVDAVDELLLVGAGDVLVFLPGEREIRQCAQALRKHHPPHVEILPLFARLSVVEQERVFKNTNARRIVLATNVAETSLTVPGIRFVVDSGLARIKRYSYRNKVEQLQIEPISQAAANQRAGRCGRVASGVCIRLYEEQDFLLRPKFTDPEILRTSLASVILRMKSLNLTDVEKFPFIEPPVGKAIADGYLLLQELGAVDRENRLTILGSELARMPLDPRIARMLLASRDNASLTEVLIIAAALSVPDPRDRPIEAQAAADAAHRKFTDEKSEFSSYLKIWKWFETALAHKKSNRQLQEFCRDNFLSNFRLREWRDVHSQLHALVCEQGWRLNEAPATYENLHLALLSGLLGNVGFKSTEGPLYLGARTIKFQVWPGSLLLKKAGRWIMAAELIETNRLYARCVAQIQPEWIEKIAGHLLKKSWGEPRWEKNAAQVVASERATLYGLVVYSQRRINFGHKNPELAREIFIREALVAGEFDTRATFMAHNQQLIREISNLEHKSRRQDVLVDDDLIATFYDKQLPDEICNGIDFTKWYKFASDKNPRLLYLDRDDLMRHEAVGVTSEYFPKKLTLHKLDLALTYHFEPGSIRDGVTLMIPIYALNRINAKRCEWLVPGMLKEKVHLLMKSLPQKIRCHCVPLPDYAANFCERIFAENQYGKGDLLDVLIADIREKTNVICKPSDFKIELLPDHMFMNFKIVDEYNRQLDMGRNIAALQLELGGQAREQFQKHWEQPCPEEMNSVECENHTEISRRERFVNLTRWTFGELPGFLEVSHKDQAIIGFPALIDKTTHCDLEVFDDPTAATRIHRAGLRRLFALQFKEQIKYLEKNIPALQQMSMQFVSLGSQEDLRTQIVELALELACMQDPLPQDEKQFVQRCDEAKSRINLVSQEIARLAARILERFQPLLKKIQGIKSHPQAINDIQSQMSVLMNKRFIGESPYTQLAHFPRYLDAVALRIDKLHQDALRDARLLSEWQQAASPYLRRLKEIKHVIEPAMTEYRWLLEELRVSLFAQEFRTPMAVSVKRLQKIWDAMQR